MLYGKCLRILAARGIFALPAGSIVLRDDGAGPYIETWNAQVLGPRPTQGELEAVTTEQAASMETKPVRTRDLLRRITAAEQDAIDDLAKTNKPLRRLMHLMLSDSTTDVNHPEFVQAWAYIKSIGVPAIWPDAATADAAIARIRA